MNGILKPAFNFPNQFQFQPSKQKDRIKTDFDSTFEFVSTTNEYNENVWDDLNKYIKRKAKTKTDDKIKKAREEILDLSDDELKHDNVKDKKSKVKKDEGDFFETAPAYDESITFQQMNLSRPLMKAITEMKFLHPTPIQSATIPPALLG